MDWKRHRDGSVWRVLATIAVGALVVGEFVVMAVFPLGASRAVDRLEALPRASARTPVAGRAVYTGRLFGPAERVSPLGVQSAAFAGWVTETTGSGKNQRTTRVCGPTGEIEQLTLAGDGVALPLGVFPGLRWARLLESNSVDYDSPRGVLDLGEVSVYNAVPGAMHAECGLGYRSGRLAYHEVSANPGAVVAVVACFDGAQLGPCAEGGEVIAVEGFGRLATAWARHAIFPVRGLGVFAAVGLAVLGFMTRRHMVTLDRRGARRA